MSRACLLAAALALVVGAGACARRAPPIAPTASVSSEAPAAAPSPHPWPIPPEVPSGWRRYSGSRHALSAAFPAPPQPWVIQQPDPATDLVGLKLEHGGAVFTLAHTRLQEKAADARRVFEGFASEFGEPRVERDFAWGPYPARDVVADDDGHTVRLRLVLMGDGLVSATVAGPADSVERLARPFFDSLHLEQLWRAQAYPTHGLLVWLPAATLEQPLAGKQPDMVGGYFWWGGLDHLIFSAGSFPIPPGAKDPLRSTVEGMVREATNVRETPVMLQGVPAVDVRMDMKGVFTRWRVVQTPTFVHMLGVAAARTGALDGPEALRFFDSARWATDF